MVLAGTICATGARAQNATWDAVPENNNFNNQFNWTPTTVPTGTAFFNTSSITSLTFGTSTTVGGLTLNAGASNYVFNNSGLQVLQFIGAGISVNGGGATIINNNDAATLFASGSAGSATITNNNSGQVEFASASTAGNATINNNNGGLVTFTNNSTAGSAKINNNNGGSISFQNNSTAGSAVIINNTPSCSDCSVTFSNSSTAGSATITNDNGSSVFFQNTSTAGSATIINNASTVSGGIINFLDSSTAGSANITNNNGGSIDFSTNSTAGSSAITNNNGGSILFSQSSTAGAAAITNNAGGVVDFSGTIGPAGNHLLSAGSIAGAGNFFLGANALTVGGNNLSTTVSGVISDCGTGGSQCQAFEINEFEEKFPFTGGSLIKVGTGTLTLSGVNTYTGPTNINAGTLDVTGSIASSSLTTVKSGATLTGTGTLGNLAFQSGAIYLVQINPSGATGIKVSGIATLTGGTVSAVFASGSYMAKQYTILTTTGGFGGTRLSGLTTTNAPATLAGTPINGLLPPPTESLSYTADSVILNLAPAFTVYSGLSTNQQSVANTLGNYFNTTGGIQSQFASLTPSGLTQLDGETTTGSQTVAFQMMNLFIYSMLDPFSSGRVSQPGGGGGLIGFAPEEEAIMPPDVALAYAGIVKAPTPAPFEQRWTAWATSYGGVNSTSGVASVGSSNISASTYGVAAGLDYHYSPDTIFGFALGGAGSNWGLADGLGTGRSDAFQAGVYGNTHSGPAYISSALAFANNWFTTNRSALGDVLTGTFTGQSYAARLEGGYRFSLMPAYLPATIVGVTPYGALQAQDFHTQSFSETDVTGGGLGLSYASMNATDVRTELGARFDDPTLVAGMPLVLLGRLAWAHDFVSNPALSAAFESLPGTGFTVFGAPIPNDSALASAGAQLFITPRWSFLAKFEGQFAPGSQTYAGTGTLRYMW